MKSNEYIKFVFSRIENDFRVYETNEELRAIMIVLKTFRNSGNVMRDIYLLSCVKKFRQLSAYLLFVIKKAEEGKISFENLLENLDLDKEYIESQLLTYFNIYPDPQKSSSVEIINEDKRKKETAELSKKVLPEQFTRKQSFLPEELFPAKEGKSSEENRKEYTISGQNFFVEELEEEIVAEEFSESDMLEEYDLSSGGKYLELVPGYQEENDAPYSLENFNGEKPKISKTDSEETKKSSATREELLKQEELLKEKELLKSSSKESAEKISPEDSTDNSSSGVNKGDVFSLPVPINEELFTAGEINVQEKEFFKESTEEELLISSSEIDIKTEKLITEKIRQDLFAGDEAEKSSAPDSSEEKDVNMEVSEKNFYQEEESAEQQKILPETSTGFSVIEESNSVYMKYEIELFMCNKLLNRDLEKLLYYSESLSSKDEKSEEMFTEKQQGEERRSIYKSGEELFLLYENIIENSRYMAGYSAEMSFEIITSIYSTIQKAFETKQSDSEFIITAEKISLFLEGICIIESLIKGDESEGIAGAELFTDKFFKKLELYRHSLENREMEKAKAEKENKQKEEFSEHLKRKFPDTNQREKLRVLHAHILEVEKIFISLGEIKGEYQAYEALRRLSATFSHFKEIVGIANSLEMFRMAQLAEASYIFIKFMRNYRVNPFETENDVDEVLKYLVDSFKRVFLDKPVKDIDLFLTYLNDPVKIISHKKN